LRDQEGAISDYTRAIELDPKLAIACQNRGDAKKAKGDLKGADEDHNRAALALRFTRRYRRRLPTGPGISTPLFPEAGR